MMLLASFLILSSQLLAQNQSTAQITGTVLDASGAPVEAAEVDVRNLSTQVVIKAQTNHSGVYNVSQLQSGRYDVTIIHQGFQTVQQNNIDLQLDQTARVNGRLTVGHVQ